MQKTINVTRRDIELGKRGDCQNCPVARAINRHLRDGFFADVHVDFKLVGVHDGACYIVEEALLPTGLWQNQVGLPIWVTRLVENFDNIGETRPFKFALDIPDKYLRNKE